MFVALAALALPVARAAAEDFDIDIPVDGTDGGGALNVVRSPHWRCRPDFFRSPD